VKNQLNELKPLKIIDSSFDGVLDPYKTYYTEVFLSVFVFTINTQRYMPK
jgi:hypothetical protein